MKVAKATSTKSGKSIVNTSPKGLVTKGKSTQSKSSPSPSLSSYSSSSSSLKGMKLKYHVSPNDEAAFAAVADNIKPFCQITGDLLRGIRIKVRYVLCSIVEHSVGITTFPSAPSMEMVGSIDGSTLATSAQFVLGLAPYRSPSYGTTGAAGAFTTGESFPNALFITTLAAAFQRWRVIGNLGLDYEPTFTTASSTVHTLAFSEDPCNLIFGLNAAAISPPSSAVLNDTPNTVVFAPWCRWGAEFAVTDHSPKYMYGLPDYNSTTSTLDNFNQPDLRMTTMGALACINNSTSSSVLQNGRLFVTAEYEFSDPLPMGGVSVLAVKHGLCLSSNPLRLGGDEKKSIESKSASVKFIIEDPDEDSPDLIEKVPPGPPMLVRQTGVRTESLTPRTVGLLAYKSQQLKS